MPIHEPMTFRPKSCFNCDDAYYKAREKIKYLLKEIVKRYNFNFCAVMWVLSSVGYKPDIF